ADCPGTNELIQHERNGLLVEAGSNGRALALCHALTRLMSNVTERNLFGKQALIDSENFRPEQTYDRWEKLSQEAAEYKGVPGKLQKEQQKIDYERALHVQRMKIVH